MAEQNLTVYDHIVDALKHHGAFIWDLPGNATIEFSVQLFAATIHTRLGVVLKHGSYHQVRHVLRDVPELKAGQDWRPAIHQSLVLINERLDDTRRDLDFLQRMLADPIRTGEAFNP